MERRRVDLGESAPGRPDTEVLAEVLPAFRLAGVRHPPWVDLIRSAAPVAADPDPALFDQVEPNTAPPDDGEQSDLDVGLDIFTPPSVTSPLAARAVIVTRPDPPPTAGRGAGPTGDRPGPGPMGSTDAGEADAGEADAAGQDARACGRVAGRHEAGARGWESRYLWKLLVVDLIAGLAVAAVAYNLRPGELAPVPDRAHFLLPVALVVALGLAGAYERRFLFVGAEEWRRVIRAGLSLMATAVIASYAVQVPLARSYVLIGLPAATLTAAALRAFLRHRLWLGGDRRDAVHRITIVGRSPALAPIAEQVRGGHAGSVLVLQGAESPAGGWGAASVPGST